MMKIAKTRRLSTVSLAGIICMLTGCGSSGDLQEAMASIRSTQMSTQGLMVNKKLPFDEIELADDTKSEMLLPSPNRTDPFEWDERFNKEAGSEERTGAHAVKILGFIETDKPRVMLSVDGQVETLAEGESLKKVEVVEIKVPRVRLSIDELTWTASIFDERHGGSLPSQ